MLRMYIINDRTIIDPLKDPCQEPQSTRGWGNPKTGQLNPQPYLKDEMTLKSGGPILRLYYDVPYGF